MSGESGAAPRTALADWMRVAARPSAGGFEAHLENHFGAAQEGDLLARCALAALAGRPGARVASARADWLAPPPPGEPLALRCEPLGTDPCCIEVRASAAREICRASCWLAEPSGSLGYQDNTPPGDVPAPETLPSTVESARKEGWPERYAAGPVEFRRVGPLWPDRAAGESTDHVTWLKLRAPLPDDRPLAQAALIFLVAFYAHWEFERRIGVRFDPAALRIRSQATQLHGELKPNEWVLLRARSRSAVEGRALGERELFARDGTLLATSVSEARVAER